MKENLVNNKSIQKVGTGGLNDWLPGPPQPPGGGPPPAKQKKQGAKICNRKNALDAHVHNPFWTSGNQLRPLGDTTVPTYEYHRLNIWGAIKIKEEGPTQTVKITKTRRRWERLPDLL